MKNRNFVWLIQRFNTFAGYRDGVYVDGLIGDTAYYSTTSFPSKAKQFRWKWLAQLWMWMNPDQHSHIWFCEWRVTPYVVEGMFMWRY